jgi:hypothetical protein
LLTPTTVFKKSVPTKSSVVNFDVKVNVRECVYRRANGGEGGGEI